MSPGRLAQPLRHDRVTLARIVQHAIHMVAPILILAVSVKAEPLTVTEVNEKRVFAGRLGHRVITSLTLESAGVRAKVTLGDIRHDRGAKLPALYRVGERVRVDGIRAGSDVVRYAAQVTRA